MPEKQKPRDRKDAYAAFAALAMTLLLTLWNMFATQDRGDVEVTSASDSTLQKKFPDACATSTPKENLGTRCMTITHTRSS
jgi:hypothetical protein